MRGTRAARSGAWGATGAAGPGRRSRVGAASSCFFFPPLPLPEALPPFSDASGVLAILAARSLLMPFLRRPSYCLSSFTLGPWSLAMERFDPRVGQDRPNCRNTTRVWRVCSLSRVMTYVIAGSCIKDDSCIEVCPVDCIHPKLGALDFETAEQLYIDPEVCIDCDACVEACPVDAIFPDFELPEKYAYALGVQRGVLRRAGHGRAHRGVMAGARPRVAVVGAGPAGAFAAACLLRARGDAEIDLLERLPTPWGLLRAGVAPDHQEIKRLEQTFDRQTLAARLPLPRQRRGRRRRLALRADAPLPGGDLRHRGADRQVAGNPRRGPARELGRDRVRRLVQRPPRLPRARVRPVGAARGGDRQRQRGGGRLARADAERA